MVMLKEDMIVVKIMVDAENKLFGCYDSNCDNAEGVQIH